MIRKDGSDTDTGRHGNRLSKPWQDPRPPTIRKVPVDSVPYGASISTNGRTVFAAYDGTRLVCVATSATEARRKYRAAIIREERDSHASKGMAVPEKC
jgi:hypothetical protein